MELPCPNAIPVLRVYMLQGFKERRKSQNWRPPTCYGNSWISHFKQRLIIDYLVMTASVLHLGLALRWLIGNWTWVWRAKELRTLTTIPPHLYLLCSQHHHFHHHHRYHFLCHLQTPCLWLLGLWYPHWVLQLLISEDRIDTIVNLMEQKMYWFNVLILNWA